MYFQVYFTLYFYVYFLIYIHLILIIIIIIIIILLGIFSCPCVLSGRCVFPVGSRSLLKLSQPVRSRQAGRSWQAGKYWERCLGLCFSENIGRTAMATFDNSYRKCYNKYNDDNKNVICHQRPKFAPYGVFAFRVI